MAFGDSIGLLFTIRSNSKDAQDDIKNLRKTFDAETKGIKDGATNAFLSLGQSVGLTGEQMAKLKTGFTAAASAAAVVGGAALAAGTAIFALTKRASDAGSEIYEFAQRTNLSAEFLSVLKVQAEQSGSTLESSAAKATKFANSLVDAARGNDELIKLLKRFGIDAAEAYRNPEAALRQFIEQFNKLPPSAANNEAAMKLFKDRSGEIIPVLRSMGTDIDGLMRKLDASGQIWTKEGTEKADEFGDALTELGQTADGLGNVFARELMPEITSTMKEITKSVTANREAFGEWGRSVGDAIRGVRELADSHLGRVVGLLAKAAYYTTPAAMLVGQTAAIGGAARDAEAIKNFGPFGGRGVETPLTKGTPGTGATAAGDVVNEAEQKAGESAATKARAEAERERERQASAVKKLADEYRSLISQVEHFNDAEVEQRIATMRLNSGVETLTGEYRKQAEALLKYNAEQMRHLDVQTQIKEAQEKARRQLEMDAEFTTRAKNALGELIGQERTHVDEVNLLILAGLKQNTVLDETLKKILLIAAAGRDAAESVGRVIDAGGGMAGANLGDIPVGAGPVVPSDGTTPPELPFSGDIFQEWGTKVGEVFGVVKEQAVGVGEIIGETFGMMANAAGGAIKAFVLFGSAGGSFRKFAAEVVASIASMAIVQAVWEAAQGLAMLALTWFTGNPKYAKSAAGHFAAAAMYGTIGGVAAVAGRALAGNAFASEGGGGGGSYGGGGATDERDDYRSRYMKEQGEKDRHTQREDRRSESTVVQLVVDGRELGRAVLNHVRDGGDLRDGFRNTLGVTG